MTPGAEAGQPVGVLRGHAAGRQAAPCCPPAVQQGAVGPPLPQRQHPIGRSAPMRHAIGGFLIRLVLQRRQFHLPPFPFFVDFLAMKYLCICLFYFLARTISLIFPNVVIYILFSVFCQMLPSLHDSAPPHRVTPPPPPERGEPVQEAE